MKMVVKELNQRFRMYSMNSDLIMYLCGKGKLNFIQRIILSLMAVVARSSCFAFDWKTEN